MTIAGIADSPAGEGSVIIVEEGVGIDIVVLGPGIVVVTDPLTQQIQFSPLQPNPRLTPSASSH